jgi:hypothetical protein
MALIAGVLMGFTFLLQISMKQPAAFLSFIACALSLVNGIWMFSTPLLIISDDGIWLKESMMRQRYIRFDEIESIDMSSERYIEIYRRNDSSVKIRMFALGFSERENFRNAMLEISSNYISG